MKNSKMNVIKISNKNIQPDGFIVVSEEVELHYPLEGKVHDRIKKILEISSDMILKEQMMTLFPTWVDMHADTSKYFALRYAGCEMHIIRGGRAVMLDAEIEKWKDGHKTGWFYGSAKLEDEFIESCKRRADADREGHYGWDCGSITYDRARYYGISNM